MTDNAYAIHGLRRKRGELAGQIITLDKQVQTLRRDLAALDRSLQLLDPSIVPARIKPIRPRKRYRFFPATELPRLLLDMMRKADGPLGSSYMVVEAMKVKDLDYDHTDTRKAIEGRVRAALQRLELRRVIQRTGAGRDAAWSINKDAGLTLP